MDQHQCSFAMISLEAFVALEAVAQSIVPEDCVHEKPLKELLLRVIHSRRITFDTIVTYLH